MKIQLRSLVGYIAPILLIAIAFLQIYRAHAYRQSPWKGGGFGMFCTVDSPGARYVRTFIVTEDGLDLEVPIPGLASSAIRRLQVIPSQPLLEKVAEATATSQWLWADYDPIARLSESSIAGADTLPPRAGTFDPSGIAKESLRPIDQPRVRLLQSGEPEPPEEAFLGLRSARAELWRMTFEGDTHTLRSERWLSAQFELPQDDEEAIHVASR
ncbi:MAG: hypothetical protein AAF604_10770 [Acidobacteriota bacterium]